MTPQWAIPLPMCLLDGEGLFLAAAAACCPSLSYNGCQPHCGESLTRGLFLSPSEELIKVIEARADEPQHADLETLLSPPPTLQLYLHNQGACIHAHMHSVGLIATSSGAAKSLGNPDNRSTYTETLSHSVLMLLCGGNEFTAEQSKQVIIFLYMLLCQGNTLIRYHIRWLFKPNLEKQISV